MRTIRWLFIPILWLCACAATSVPYTVLERGIVSGPSLVSPAFEVITDEARFHQVFKRLHADQLPPPASPTIDFAREFVILVAMGQQPTTGYRIEVEQMERYGSVLRVRVRFQEADPQARHATMLTQPFVLLKIPRMPGLKQVKVLDRDAKELASLSFGRI